MYNNEINPDYRIDDTTDYSVIIIVVPMSVIHLLTQIYYVVFL